MHLSPNDSNQYRALTLSNDLSVLLVHSPNSSKSAAALAVNVGHFDDPDDRQGLAHYLEHMLFLGTEKYPNVGEFQAFINQNGGNNNAWTGTEHTCFFFDIAPKQYNDALDRFSQFFTAPLFNEEALDKERQAVESEYKMKLNDDSRRIYQVNKELMNPKHPFAKFSVGNLHTLGDRDGQSIRSEIIDFYQTQYSADLMTLTLVSCHSLDEMQQWAKEKFSAIRNNHKADKTISEPFLLPEQQQLKMVVEPVKEVRRLVLTFNLPGMNQHYRTKPLTYFSHLLGYEGEGSLLIALKERGWITSLSAGGGASGSNYREFTISCALTELGLQHQDDIIQGVFQFIQLIKLHGMQQWRYSEKQAVLESAFRFQEPARALDLASHLVMNMQNYAPEDVIYGDYMMSHYDEAQLSTFAEYFSLANLRVSLIAKEQHYDRKAKWYDTPYSIAPISADKIAFYGQIDPAWPFTLPPENPFICYDLDPAPIEKKQPTPVLIENSEGFRLWHKQDSEFRVPKGVVYIAIDSPHSVSCPRNIVKTKLCVEMFMEALAKETYQAEIAGMGYNMYAHQGGVTLTLSGFSKQQPQLLHMILTRFAERNFDPERFNTIKQQMLRNWRNTLQDRPISQLVNALTGILQPNNPPYPVLIEALESIQVDELADFVQAILSELHIEMFVYGDWDRKHAHKVGNALKQALSLPEQRYEESLRPLIMLGNQGTFQREVYCNQADSAIVVYYQCHNTDANSIATYTLANHLMSAAFFHDIRTKQQLGYMVGTGNMPLNRHPGLALYVQSPNAAPHDLIIAIDEFLNAFYMVLLELTEQQWQQSKIGLLNQISTPDITLRSRGQRLWVAIGNKDHSFDQREQVIEHIRELSRSDMIRFVVNQLKPRTANRLIMHAKGHAHEDESPLSLGQEIGSIDEFQLRSKDCDLE